jgi:uncharacterized membrane protein
MKDLSPQANPLLEEYLEKLRKILKPLSPEESEEIVLEIKGHILESLSLIKEEKDEVKNLTAVLEKLGDPEDYAPGFVTDYILEKGVKEKSIGLIFRGFLRWGFSTITGFVSVILFFALYLLSFSLVIIGILKPFFPKDIGFFVKGKSFEGLGYIKNVSSDPQIKELLGYAFVPMAIILGILIFFVATWLLKKIIKLRVLRSWRMLSPAGQASSIQPLQDGG